MKELIKEKSKLKKTLDSFFEGKEWNEGVKAFIEYEEKLKKIKNNRPEFHPDIEIEGKLKINPH